MKLFQRIKNLWELSEYKLDERQGLIKDFPTIKKQMATIIQEKVVDVLEEEIKDDTTR